MVATASGMSKRDPLLKIADKFMVDLMKAAGGDSVTVRERAMIMSALTRYLAVKNKIEPEISGEDDFLGRTSRALGVPAKTGGHLGRAGGRGTAPGPDSIPLNPPAPAGRAVALDDFDGHDPDGQGGEHITKAGSSFWRPASNGADPVGTPAAPAGPDRGDDPGDHGDA